jgi:hypothetical protein
MAMRLDLKPMDSSSFSHSGSEAEAAIGSKDEHRLAYFGKKQQFRVRGCRRLVLDPTDILVAELWFDLHRWTFGYSQYAQPLMTRSVFFAANSAPVMTWEGTLVYGSARRSCQVHPADQIGRELQYYMINGGPTGIIGAFIFVMCGVLSQAVVMAEMASM